MRKLLVMMALLGATSLVHGQELIIRKATARTARKSAQWASQYQPANNTPALPAPVAPPVSMVAPQNAAPMLPAPANNGPQSNAYNQAPAIIHSPAPVAAATAPGVTPGYSYPAGACPAGGCAAPGAGCAGKCHHGCDHSCCGKLWDFFTYRRSCSKTKEFGDCYHGARPLYEYFLDNCREGACHGVHQPRPCPKCATCGFGGPFNTGHGMFVWPTGQGVVGAP
ncbi:MAG: hypothetical protein U0840_23650 [Gemmataceae bacterium]